MHQLVYFYPNEHAFHSAPNHPERPERVEAIVSALNDLDLWEPFPKLQPLIVPEHVLLGVHTRTHLTNVERYSQLAQTIDTDTYLTQRSWDLALQAAGGACSVASAVWQRIAERGFALCRPPGHHATPDEMMGFCLINNIAVAAEYLLREMGAQRIAIVDIDLHHGNGTQDIFYNRGDVFFISTHQSPLYPGTGMLNETGRREGAGRTMNIPLPPFSGDSAFTAAMDELIFPALERFQPEILLVSAGMDVHWRDPLGHLLVSAAGYHGVIGKMTAFADEHCKGRIALFLEGGYDLAGGSACAAGAVTALLGAAFADSQGVSPYREQAGWREVIDRGKRLFSA